MYTPLPLGYYGSSHLTCARADLVSRLPGVAAALDHHVIGMLKDKLWSAVEWLHA